MGESGGKVYLAEALMTNTQNCLPLKHYYHLCGLAVAAACLSTVHLSIFSWQCQGLNGAPCASQVCYSPSPKTMKLPGCHRWTVHRANLGQLGGAPSPVGEMGGRFQGLPRAIPAGCSRSALSSQTGSGSPDCLQRQSFPSRSI